MLWQPELSPELREALMKGAEDRGLPLLFPLMDLEDQAQLSAKALWSGDQEAIRRASLRYSPEVILVGRLKRLPTEEWRGSWSLLLAQQSESWEGDAGSMEAVGFAAVQGVADRLAAQLVPAGGESAGESTTVVLSVVGISSVEDYAKLRARLAGLNSITGFRVRQAEPEAMHYELQVRGGVEVLENELALSGGLIKTQPPETAPAPTEEPEPNPHLYYRLQP